MFTALEMDNEYPFSTNWGNPASDPQSMAQEKMYQMELQKRINQKNSNIITSIGDHHSDKETNGGRPESQDEESEENDFFYDSLEISTTVGNTESKDNSNTSLKDESHQKMLRKCQLEEDYTDLSFEPSWRSNSNEAKLSKAQRSSPSHLQEGLPFHDPSPYPENGMEKKHQCFPRQTFAKKQHAKVFPKLNHTCYLTGKKEARAKQDIVEQNKKTLGVTPHRHGSYLRTFSQRINKGDVEQNEVDNTDEISSVSGQKSHADLERENRLLQNTKKNEHQPYLHLKSRSPESPFTHEGPYRVACSPDLPVSQNLLERPPLQVCHQELPGLSSSASEDSNSILQTNNGLQESNIPTSNVTAHNPGPYLVLPPIGQASGGNSDSSQENMTIQRSTSEGYLNHLQKEKQLKERMGYKAYTIKDYKTLQKDIKLGGLGPEYAISEITVERKRRQREYSVAIREQNKVLGTGKPPLPPAKAVDKDDKAIIPRLKGLEYARTIPKPKAPVQPKASESTLQKNFIEQARYLEELDVAQLTMLEHLQMRHEKEKKAVADFKVLV